MVELVALEIDLGAAEMTRQPLGEIERAGPADVMFEIIVELGLKTAVASGGRVGGLDCENERHQCLGDKAPAINAAMAAFVRPASGGVRDLHPHPSARAAARKARILAGSFSPGRLSTPEETSTAAAPETRTASGS